MVPQVVYIVSGFMNRNVNRPLIWAAVVGAMEFRIRTIWMRALRAASPLAKAGQPVPTQ
jgi:hypothetical protein